MFNQFDVVRLKTDLPEDGVAAGAIATILDVYDSPPGYEVEVSDANGATLFLGGVPLDAVELLTEQGSQALDRIVDKIEAELADDEVGLWVIARALRDEWSVFEPAHMSQLATQVCRELMGRGATLGQFDGQGDFAEWPADSAIDRVLAEWSELGRDPTIGEIAWLRRGDAATSS